MSYLGNINVLDLMDRTTYDAAAVAEQVVGLTATQTLSNKSFAAPDIGDAIGTSVDVSDYVQAGGNIIAGGATSVIRLQGYTVSGLPSGTIGDTAYCTDLLAPTFFTVAVGGGAVVGPVFYNGAAWICT